MQSSKTLSLLRSLNTKELRQFSVFIKSPFFLKSTDALAVYEYLIRYAPDFSSPNLSKEIIFKKLFPKQTYSDIKLRNLMRKITKILEEYLIILEFRKEEKQKKKQLKSIYGKRNLYSYFDRETRYILEEQEILPFRDSEYFFEKYELLKDWYFHPGTQKNAENVKWFEEALRAFFKYVLIEKLQFKCEFKNREKIFKESYFLEDLETIPVENVTIELFQSILQLIDSQDENLFFRVKRTFEENIKKLRGNDIGIIYPFLLNFAIQQSSKKEIKYFKELFSLYKIGIENRFLIINGQIKGITFVNIVVAGSKLKEFDWVDSFIRTNYQFLRSNFQESYLSLAKGFLAFHKQDFNETINQLLTIDFKGQLISISERTLLNRAYFELFLEDDNYFPLLIYSLSSFNKHIRRQSQLNEEKKMIYLNFVIYLRKLAKLIQKDDLKNIQKLKHQIIKEPLLISKSWILDKVNTKLAGQLIALPN